MSRTYAGPSDSQANADALARRSSPYTAAHDASLRVRWDWHRREPSDLREAVRMVRRAYSDEVPDKLHDGHDSLADDGTPRMTARAVGYIFGREESSDAPPARCTCKPDTALGFAVHMNDCAANPDNRPLVSYYHSPFRACLAVMGRGSTSERRRAAIVRHVTIGAQRPVAAAVAEGAHPIDAKLVAEDAIRSFLRNMTDLKLHPRQAVPETETAA